MIQTHIMMDAREGTKVCYVHIPMAALAGYPNVYLPFHVLENGVEVKSPSFNPLYSNMRAEVNRKLGLLMTPEGADAHSIPYEFEY